jgi:hypothetical protein
VADTSVFATYGTKTKREFYETLLATLKGERSSFDPHWQDLADYILPRRVRFSVTERNKGDKRRERIIDSTASFSARTLQSGLHAGLTSPARPWFKLGTPDPDLADFGPVKEWLHVVTQRMQTVFAQTNLYNALPVVYGDLGTFGTAAMSVIADDRDLFRCYTYPLGSYVLSMDARGRVAVFIREYELTVRQVVEQFGGVDGERAVPGQPINWDRISTRTKDLWEQGTYEAPINMVWAVSPNPSADANRLGARFMPYASCYFERSEEKEVSGTRKLLRESGFRSFPILAPRWDITGEDAYGTESPGQIALGDVKQLQIMQRKKNQAIAKIVDPPLVGPVALRTQKTSLLPGDITYVDQREGQSGLRSIHEIGLNLEHMWRNENQCQYRIQRAFYEDLFLMLATSDQGRGTQPITAREVEERHEEKLLALGPVLERTNDELLDPLIDRAYEMMEREGLIPEPPEELNGVTLKVEYVSIMAQAQKLVGVVGQDRFMQTLLPMMEAFPEVRRKVKIFQVIDNYAAMLGIDPRALVTTEEAEAAVAADAKAQAAAQGAAVMKDAAAAGKNLAEIPIGQGEGTVLDRVLSGAGA